MLKRLSLALVCALALAGAVPAHALTPAQRVAVLSNPCARYAVKIDFVKGAFCKGGGRYGSFLAMPGASFARASVGTATWADGHVSTFASGVPRITDQGLLVEESRTNLLLRSQQFTVSPWATAAGGTGTAPTVTDNAAIAPDGTQTAARIQFAQGAGTTINDFSGVQQTAVGTANPETHSIWLRSNTGSNQLVALRSLDLAADFTVVTATTTWQRFTFTSTATTTSAGLQLIVRGTYGTTSAADVLAWGAQLEQASFATSYIPTTSAAATRAADNVSVLTALSAPLTLIASGVLQNDTSANKSLIGLSDGTSQNRALLYVDTSQRPVALTTVSNATVATLTLPTAIASSSATIGGAFASADYAVTFGGNSPNTATTVGALPTTSRVVIGNGGSGTNAVWNSYISKVTIYPGRVPNAQLKALTQ